MMLASVAIVAVAAALAAVAVKVAATAEVAVGPTATVGIAFTASDLTRFRLRNLNFLKMYFSLQLRNYIQKC